MSDTDHEDPQAPQQPAEMPHVEPNERRRMYGPTSYEDVLKMQR